MDARFDNPNQNNSKDNSLIINLDGDTEINFVEIERIINILSRARIERKQSLYQPTLLITLVNVCFFGIALYLLIQGSIDAAKRENVFTELFDLEVRRSTLKSGLSRVWSLPILHNGHSCDEVYPPGTWNICPPPLSVTVEICKHLLVDYCKNLAELNAREAELNASLPDAAKTVTFIICGLFFSVVAIGVFCWKLTTWRDRAEQEPTSHPYIPEIHRNHIKEIAKFLAIKIDPAIPIAKIIQEFRDRQINREKRLAFLRGSIGKSNRSTALFRFFALDGDRELTHKILDYVDPALPYRALHSPNEKAEAAKEEPNELTPLKLGHT